MIIVTHLVACGWFIISCLSLSIGAEDPHTCQVDSWVINSNVGEGYGGQPGVFVCMCVCCLVSVV